jgi:hypothetical protein
VRIPRVAVLTAKLAPAIRIDRPPKPQLPPRNRLIQNTPHLHRAKFHQVAVGDMGSLRRHPRQPTHRLQNREQCGRVECCSYIRHFFASQQTLPPLPRLVKENIRPMFAFLEEPEQAHRYNQRISSNLPMKTTRPWHLIRIMVVLSIGLAVFFCLPFLLGEPGTTSESSMFGYDNCVAMLIFAVLASVFVVSQKGLGLMFPPQRPANVQGLSRRLLWSTAFLSAGLATMVWLAARPGIGFRESAYFLDRYAMYELGQRLYRDIDYSYGPLMFYLPVAFSRITGLTLVDSFFVTWILQWFAGVAVLWKVIDIAARATGSRHGRAIYLMLWLVVVLDVLAAGPNYTPLRYASGLLLAMLVWRLFSSRTSAVPAGVCAALGSVVLILYSPEQGLALAFASIVFFAFNGRHRKDFPLAAVLFLLIFSTGLAWAASLGELGMIRAVSFGALNMPIFFSTQNISFVLLLLVAASASWNAIRTRRTGDPLLYIAMVAGACVPAAFGQANPGHMFYNLLGAIVAALFVLSSDSQGTRTGTWTAVKIGFAIIFIFGCAVERAFMDHTAITIPLRRWIVASGNHGSMLQHAYVAAMSKALGSKAARAKLAQMDDDAASAATGQPDLQGLPSGTLVLAPFGIDRPAHQEAGGLRVFTGRYPWLLPLLNSHVTSDKIAELQSHPDLPLLIPDVSDGSQCRYNPRTLRQSYWQNVLPFYIPPVRHPMTSAEPLCAYINANYRRVAAPSDPGKPAIWLPIDPRGTLSP